MKTHKSNLVQEASPTRRNNTVISHDNIKKQSFSGRRRLLTEEYIKDSEKPIDRAECLHIDAKCSFLLSQTPLEYKNIEGDNLKLLQQKDKQPSQVTVHHAWENFHQQTIEDVLAYIRKKATHALVLHEHSNLPLARTHTRVNKPYPSAQPVFLYLNHYISNRQPSLWHIGKIILHNGIYSEDMQYIQRPCNNNYERHHSFGHKSVT